MTPFSRREFMIMAGTTAAAAAMLNVRRALAFAYGPGGGGFTQEGTGIDWDNELNSYNEIYGNPPLLGRVHVGNRVSIWKGPSPSSGRVRNVFGGSGVHGSYIAPIYSAVRGERYDARFHSTVWYETIDGYMHSAHLIPCHEIFNQPEEAIGNGFWGEVTVPESKQHKRPSFEGAIWDYDHYKCFWSTVHRVLDRADDAEGRAWYRLYDDLEPNRQTWVQAAHIRRVTPEELSEISPEVQDKRIVIDLGRQRIVCYEEGVLVFETQIASGTSYQNDEGEEFDFSTPEGAYHVQRKRPSRRMKGGEHLGLAYDVNGVPWCTYFSYTGAAVHGAYWHNNFGLPRSHGCINVTADAAKWIFRWSQPHLGYDEDYRWVQEGEHATPIEIIL